MKLHEIFLFNKKIDNLYKTININSISGITNDTGYIYVPFIFVDKTQYEILRIERKTKLERLNEIIN